MTEAFNLPPVDRVETTTLYENMVDQTVPGGGPVERLSSASVDQQVTTLLADERRVPLIGGHGLSMLVRMTGDGITRSVLFDAGGSPAFVQVTVGTRITLTSNQE